MMAVYDMPEISRIDQEALPLRKIQFHKDCTNFMLVCMFN